jgi:hypothetical protein
MVLKDALVSHPTVFFMFNGVKGTLFLSCSGACLLLEIIDSFCDLVKNVCPRMSMMILSELSLYGREK